MTYIMLALILLLCSCGQPSATGDDENTIPTWQEQYDLGVRYLSEGNYEEAIIAFTAAIEIDPKQAAAYVGRGDVYVALAGQETDRSAALDLREKAIADYERALELGGTQAERKLEESRKLIQQLRAEADAQPLLETLYVRFAEDDIEGAKALMRQADYRELSTLISEDSYHYDHGDGSGIAVYPNNFYYFGQWENGVRSGQGLWICAAFEDDSDVESYTYEGAWADDRPNGEGHIVWNRYPEKIQVEPNHTTSVKTEVTGAFTNGLYHGTIYETWNMNDGSILVWSPIIAVNGVYQPMQNVPDEVKNRQYYQDSVSSGMYIVALDQDNQRTDLWNSGEVNAVQGFDEGT
jgi:hypothetical protein